MGLIRHIRTAAGVQITKEWITGIRKSWKKVISQVARVQEKHEGLDTIGAIENAIRYLKLLQQDLFFGKGMYPFQDSRQPLTKQLKQKAPFNIQAKVGVFLEQAIKDLDDSHRAMTFWMRVTNPQSTEYKLDGGKRYKEIVENPQWFTRSEGQAITKFLNDMAGQLAAEAAKDADAEISGKLLRALSGFVGKYPGMDIGVQTDRDFSIGNVKVVFQDVPMLDLKKMKPEQIEEIRSPLFAKRYVKPLATAKALLDKKKLGYLWYGTIFVKPKGTFGPNPRGEQFGVGGWWDAGKDSIFIEQDPHPGLYKLVVHEIGHRYYYKFMSMADRLEFSSYFGQVPGVSDYGKTVSEEDFAEVFAWYVLNKELTRDQIERFKKFLGRKQQRGAAVEKRPDGLIQKLKDWYHKYTDVADDAAEDSDEVEPAVEDMKDWYKDYFDETTFTRDSGQRRGGLIMIVRGRAAAKDKVAKSTGGLKGPFTEKHKYGDETFYTMDVGKDRFIHFTTVEAAKAIVASKKMLLRPPGVEHFGPVGVFAVSLVWGWYLPGVQLTHIKSDKPLVAVVFTTDTVPNVAAHHEEVIWTKDVKLKTVQVVSKGKAVQLLKKVPFPLKDEDAYVLYR